MFIELVTKYLYQYWVFLMGIFYDLSRAETLDLHTSTHGYSQRTVVCGKLTQSRGIHSLPLESERKVRFYGPCFVCSCILKSLNHTAHQG